MDFNFFFTASSQCISSHGNPTLICSRSLGLFPKLHSCELSQESQTTGEELELRGGRGGIRFPGTSREREFFYLYTQVLGTMEYLRMLLCLYQENKTNEQHCLCHWLSFDWGTVKVRWLIFDLKTVMAFSPATFVISKGTWIAWAMRCHASNVKALPKEVKQYEVPEIGANCSW